ncbi:EscN/YscN/HrcN family type III secretion system ATPase [Exilibacterium tricleocarpae]|uniref:Type 3 secretion system ATPase n=1 Tax=Exilibacterium tricleocarpae TaxID=2591008 RepID=A0A545SYD3_9GAMM|nr:type III secretion system ATPase SctN [Exilibacterium tricleocarpae]TQV69949.1 EscN/YscN/HrcN family type III secretion system ATPase [Exilibacterium tricleocarpae]
MSEFSYIADIARESVNQSSTLALRGRVSRVSGTLIEVLLPHARVGDLCVLKSLGQASVIWAEVIGLSQGAAVLTPLGDMRGISTDTEVIPTGQSHRVRVGPALLGRVLNGLGDPLDTETKGPLVVQQTRAVQTESPDPLLRRPIDRVLPLGVRAVDGLMCCGEGQRMGIFAAAGVGKSSLLAMMARYAQADINVVVLIGERGREVREFIDIQLGEQGMKNTVLVVATADRPAMQRVRAAYVGTTIAEYFRDQNKKVLLLMDSVTRFARALREIGLAAGEPPTRRGFPSSVFSAIPKLVERAGHSAVGSITGLYTVLVEGDDMNEPVADEMRSILDGHIILSRELAAESHFPAIDVLNSLSRVMNSIASPQHKAVADRFRGILAKYNDIEFLVRMGEYKPGTDTSADEALEKIDAVKGVLRQGFDEYFSLDETLEAMRRIL